MLDWTQHVIPAPGTNPNGNKIDDDTRHNPPIVCIACFLPGMGQVEVTQRPGEARNQRARYPMRHLLFMLTLLLLSSGCTVHTHTHTCAPRSSLCAHVHCTSYYVHRYIVQGTMYYVHVRWALWLHRKSERAVCVPVCMLSTRVLSVYYNSVQPQIRTTYYLARHPV